MNYALTGYKWGSTTEGTSSGVITWSADFVTELDHNGSYTDAQFEFQLQAAFDSWEEVASVDFQMVEADASVQVGAADLDYLGTDAVGVAFTSYSFASDLNIATSATIDFDTTGTTWSPEGASGTVDFFAVALHEIGHVLGLAHPVPDDETEIMNRYVATDELGDGDIAGIQRLYGTDAADESPPSDSGGETTGDGGGGGGGAILGLLALVFGLLFGGVGAGAVLAAGRMTDTDEDDDDPEDESNEIFLSDLVPTVDHDHEEGAHPDTVNWREDEEALAIFL